MTRHTAILTNMLLSFSLAAGLLCAASDASAQTAERATVPFAFSADHQQFPAGTYEVRRCADGVMSVSNLETGKTELLMVRLEAARAVETHGRLVFHHDEAGNTLMQVWIAGTTIDSELMVQPKIQQAVAKNDSSAGSSIQVAIK